MKALKTPSQILCTVLALGVLAQPICAQVPSPNNATGTISGASAILDSFEERDQVRQVLMKEYNQLRSYKTAEERATYFKSLASTLEDEAKVQESSDARIASSLKMRAAEMRRISDPTMHEPFMNLLKEKLEDTSENGVLSIVGAAITFYGAWNIWSGRWRRHLGLPASVGLMVGGLIFSFVTFDGVAADEY